MLGAKLIPSPIVVPCRLLALSYGVCMPCLEALGLVPADYLEDLLVTFIN
jgi:hypothetical protein